MRQMQLLKAASSAASRLLRPQASILEASARRLAGVNREGSSVFANADVSFPNTLARGLVSSTCRQPQAGVANPRIDAFSGQVSGVSWRTFENVHHLPSSSRLYPATPVAQTASLLLQESARKAHFTIPTVGNITESMNASRSYSTDNRMPPKQSETEEEELEEGENEGAWEDGDGGMGGYETILAEVLDGGQIGLLTINRPDVLNALSTQVMFELADALQEFDADPAVKAIILTGSGNKAFAAGADIKEMRDQDFVSAYLGRLLSGYEAATSACRTPIIAAVNGYALGGGCELAMMCDVILAGKKAVFGQPETNLGVIPGMGGTQRLIRAVGKSRAMEMILSGGHFIQAEEAVARGLASRVVPGDSEQLLDAAIELAQEIARKSVPVVALAKEAVNSANDFSLSEGVKKENMLFSACFGLRDQKEGMTAFLEKRKPNFEDK